MQKTHNFLKNQPLFILNFIKNKISYLLWFFYYLRLKIFFGLTISITVGLLDSIGLTMFFPLFQMVSGDSNSNDNSVNGVPAVFKLINEIAPSHRLIFVLGLIVFFFAMKGLAKYF